MRLYSLLILSFHTATCWGQQIALPDELGSYLSEHAVWSVSERQIETNLLSSEFRPINLNHATLAELRAFSWLTPLQIKNLFSHLSKNGPLVSIYELQAIPGWDLATIGLTKSFVRVNETAGHHDSRSLLEKFESGESLEFIFQAKRRLELSSGYSLTGNKGFQGAPIHWLYRIGYHEIGSMRFGITAEKDAGERFDWNSKKNQWGPDYLSMHFQLENKGVLKRLILGDYRAQWDQGLVLSNSFNLGQQVITGPRKVHRGLFVHTGSQEYGYFSGIGVELQFSDFLVSTFYSFRHLDARVHPGDPQESQSNHVTSILETGLHRTDNESDGRKSLSEHLVGLRVSKNWKSTLTLALSALYKNLSLPIIPTSTRYNRYLFHGKQNLNYSGSIEYLWKNLNIYGQFALSSSMAWGGLFGIVVSASHRASFSIHFRNFGRDFHSIAGQAFGVQTRNINEQGVYLGIQVTPSNNWVLDFSSNLYKFPVLSFMADATSYGVDHLARLQYLPDNNKSIGFYWKIRTRSKNLNLSPKKLTNDLMNTTKHALGIRAKWLDTSNLVLFTNIQYSNLHTADETTSGLIVNNRISYERNFIKLTISGALFNTDNFENRQYIYESNFPHSLSIPFFTGTGIRWYCMIRLKWIRLMDLWIRIAQTRFDNTGQIGSGIDTITGNKRTDLSFQLRLKL